MIPNYSAVIDWETTGFDAIRNDGVSLGVEMLNRKLQPIDHLYLKFKPDIYKGVTEENVATHIHDFTLREMAFFPERRDSLIQLMKFLSKYKDPLNKPIPLFFHADRKFDYLFLEWAFRKENLEYSLFKIFDITKQYSTLLMARDLGYQGNKLKEDWGVRLNQFFNHHNALADAKMCGNVIRYILENNFQGNVESLFDFIINGKKEDEKKEVQEVFEVERPWSFFDLPSC